MARTQEQIREETLNELPGWQKDSLDSVTSSVIDAFASEGALLSTNIDAMHDAVFVDTATGSELDDLAEMFRIVRQSGETDASLRGRIKSYWAGFTGGGTTTAIEESLETALGLAPGTIVVTQSKTTTDQHLYNASISRYPLNQKTVTPASVVLNGIVSSLPFLFVQGVDYSIVDNDVQWLGATVPDNASVFTVAYTYTPDLKLAVTIPVVSPSDIDLARTTEDQNKAAGILIENTFDFTGSPFADGVTVTDSVTITSTSTNGFFVIELSLIEGGDVTT